MVDDPQALVQSDSFFGNDVENVCVNNDSHPGSENTLLYNSTSNRDVASFSCGGRHDRVVVDNLRSYVQEILYGSGNNVSGTRDQLLIQLSENTELLTDDVYSGVE